MRHRPPGRLDPGVRRMRCDADRWRCSRHFDGQRALRRRRRTLLIGSTIQLTLVERRAHRPPRGVERVRGDRAADRARLWRRAARAPRRSSSLASRVGTLPRTGSARSVSPARAAATRRIRSISQARRGDDVSTSRRGQAIADGVAADEQHVARIGALERRRDHRLGPRDRAADPSRSGRRVGRARAELVPTDPP